MIVFVCTEAHQYTLRELLEHYGSALTGRIALLAYGEFLQWPKLPVGHYVMADLERLTPDQRDAVAARLDALKQAVTPHLPTMRCLNHPHNSLGRIDLLTELHATGVNRFRIFSAKTLPEGLPDPLERPMFVRGAEDHVGARTDLLTRPTEVREAVAALARGEDAQPPMEPSAIAITEYVDVSNAAGHHEKYSVFRLGDALFSVTYDVSTNWVNKGYEEDYVGPEQARAELTFVKTNPHGALLKPVFEAAGITYGRVDYAFTRDDPEQRHPQIFEINTNPMIETPVGIRAEWAEASAVFTQLYEQAFLTWAAEGGAPNPGAPRDVAVGAASRILPLPQSFGTVRTLLRAGLRRIGRLHWETHVTRWLVRLKP